MNNEEYLKIDLSEKVLAVRQQEKEISHKVHFIQLEIVSSVQADAHYSIDKGANQIQGNISISSRLDSLDRYTKRIDIDDHRNSSLTIRFYAFGQLHTELILKMLPPPLLVKSALFKKGNEKVQANCMDVDSDKNFVISVELTRPVMNGEQVKLHYKYYDKNPGCNVFKEDKDEAVDMESYDVRKEFTFYAPKNYSGSTLAISFYVNEEVEPNESKEQHSVRYYKIISTGGAKINAVYWSQDEKFTPIQKNGETVDYENSNVRNEICNNEDGYLHIHTQQMYGQRVKVCVVERDRVGEDAAVISREVLITDNKACVIFPMQELLPKLYSLRCAWLEGDNFDLVAIVKPVNENIPEKESVSPLYLKIDKRSYTPAKSTHAGTRKFVIGSADEEKQEEKRETNKCECEERVKAFMRMLRVGEGTVGKSGYEKLFGGESFIKDHKRDWSTHPQILISKGGIKSTAAGAYQIMGYTYKELNGWSKSHSTNLYDKYTESKDYFKKHNIFDFSPLSQDLICLVILRYKRNGILKLITGGNIKEALEKYGSYEWASLPPGRYGQPSKTMNEALVLYDKYYKEELSGKSDLHLKQGFLKGLYSECWCKHQQVSSLVSGYDIDKAVAKLISNEKIKSEGVCAKHIRIAIEAGGLSTEKRPNSAKDYDKFLPTIGFSIVAKEKYIPQKGDIVVIQNIDKHPHGHIAMYDGQHWVSDFKQIDFWGGPSYRIIKPKHTFFRWKQ